MIVLYWMTPDPITLTEDQTLLDVWKHVRDRKIRRLPVVREGDQLVGMVGLSDLYRYVTREEIEGPEDAIRERLEGVTVAKGMTPEPVTCDANEPLEVVSERMRGIKVGAFPVMHRGHLVGIISETDILRALGELAWHHSDAHRITVKVTGGGAPERKYELIDLCRRYGMELLAVLTHPVLEDSALMTTMRVKGERVEDLEQALWKAGFDVVDRI